MPKDVRVKMGPRFMQFLQIRYPELWADFVSQGVDGVRWFWMRLSRHRCGFFWPKYRANCQEATRSVNVKYGDGLVLDVVPDTPLEVLAAYFDVDVCEDDDSRRSQLVSFKSSKGNV